MWTGQNRAARTRLLDPKGPPTFSHCGGFLSIALALKRGEGAQLFGVGARKEKHKEGRKRQGLEGRESSAFGRDVGIRPWPGGRQWLGHRQR